MGAQAFSVSQTSQNQIIGSLATLHWKQEEGQAESFSLAIQFNYMVIASVDNSTAVQDS